MRHNTVFKTAAVLSFCLGLLFLSMSCKSVNGPDEEFEARLLIYNNCGARVDIFLDDVLYIALDSGSNTTIQQLTEAEHKLAAFLTGTDTLVLMETFNATASGDYTWTINGQATILMINEYGETVDIYEGGEYVGYLEADDTGPITDVPFGSYSFEATLFEETTVIATITIEVTEVKEYSWVIE